MPTLASSDSSGVTDKYKKSNVNNKKDKKVTKNGIWKPLS